MIQKDTHALDNEQNSCFGTIIMPNNELKHTFETVYEIGLHGKVHLWHYAK